MAATAAALERAMRFQEVILQATRGKMSWWQAADVLGISPRTKRRWRLGYQRFGLKGLEDKRRVDRAPNGVRESEIKRWLQLYEHKYPGYNVRHFYSMLKRKHGGCEWSYTVVRRALQVAGLVKEEAAAWTALHPPRATAMLRRDAPHRHHGIPQCLYSDRAGWATHTLRAGQLVDRTRLTQVGRALHQLGVEHIMAYSPQARGRSERANRTLQDRLVKELQSHGIRTMTRANRYLDEVFVAAFNEEFSRAPAEPESGFAPLGSADLEAIFCHCEARQVQRDNTITLDGVLMQIPRQAGRRTCAGLNVEIRRHLDGTHTLYWGTKLLGRYSPQGRALSKEPLVHPATASPVAAA